MSNPKGEIPELDRWRNTGNQQMYFKVFQDRDSIGIARYWVADLLEFAEQMMLWGEDDTDELPPIAEPVFLTQAEYDELPEFEGY